MHRGYAGWGGVPVATCGLMVRTAAMRTLGTSYRLWLQVREDDRLVMVGLHSVVRDPGYAGLLLQLLGLQLATARGLAVTAVIGVVAMLPIRVAVEEAMLVEHLGKHMIRAAVDQLDLRRWSLFVMGLWSR